MKSEIEALLQRVLIKLGAVLDWGPSKEQATIVKDLAEAAKSLATALDALTYLEDSPK